MTAESLTITIDNAPIIFMWAKNRNYWGIMAQALAVYCGISIEAVEKHLKIIRQRKKPSGNHSKKVIKAIRYIETESRRPARPVKKTRRKNRS